MRKPARIAWLALLLAAGGGSAFAADEGPHFSAELIEKGERLAVAADCQACHTQTGGGERFAGGYSIATPVGVIYTTNITPDKETGIGRYSEAQFARAVREGIRADGTPLYPAMPYTSYVKLNDEDIHALYAYFMNGVAPSFSTTGEPNCPSPLTCALSCRPGTVCFWKRGISAPTAAKMRNGTAAPTWSTALDTAIPAIRRATCYWLNTAGNRFPAPWSAVGMRPILLPTRSAALADGARLS